MDLKTGNLLWPTLSAPLLSQPPIARDISCDAVVLGAGISGVSAALALAEVDLDVVVIDRRGVAEGSTPASTALVQYEIDNMLIELAHDIGPEKAQMAYRACRATLDHLVELTQKHQISCDLKWTGSLFLAESADEAQKFVTEAAARQAIGIEVEPLSHREVMDRFDINRPAALHSLAAMELDPYKLTQGLARAAEKLGARFFQSEVTSLDLEDSRQHLKTADGYEVRCDHLIIATGYETPEQFRDVRKYCQLKSTYALASEPLSRAPWPGGVMIWESADPYFYARQSADNRVIIGGEDELIVDADSRDALIDAKSKKLVEKFSVLRPGMEIAPEYCWAGTFAESPDGMPYIGSLPKYPGCHFALGYGGNGLTFSMLAAQLIRDSILNRPNVLSPVFSFDR